MTTIQEKTNYLHEQWKNRLAEDGYNADSYCQDGLMYRGHKWHDGANYVFESGEEEQLWEEAPLRILFLLKDSNGNPGEDARSFCINLKTRTNRNLSYWFYLLFYGREREDARNYTFTNEDAELTINEQPFALVNCKKISGGARVTNKEIQEHIDNYGKYIKEELELLDADIIVCGGGNGIIANFVLDSVYPSYKQINKRMYYDEKANKLIIDSYHPAYYGKSSEYIYTDMCEAYMEFLDNYPNFASNCRCHEGLRNSKKLE